MSIGLAYVRCCAIHGAAISASSNASRMLLVLAAAIRRPDVLCAHATHLQPPGRSGVWIGHVHPPPLLWIAHHAQRAPTRFEFRTVRPHARDLGARVGDHFD